MPFAANFLLLDLGATWTLRFPVPRFKRARGVLMGSRGNFGAKESREISSAAESIAHDGMAPTGDRRRAAQLDMAFSNWTATYTGS